MLINGRTGTRTKVQAVTLEYLMNGYEDTLLIMFGPKKTITITINMFTS